MTFPAQIPPHVAMGSTELSRKVYTGTWAAVITRHSPCSWYESMRVLKKGFFSPNLRKSPSRLGGREGRSHRHLGPESWSLSRFHVLRSGSQFREKGLSPCVTMLAPSYPAAHHAGRCGAPTPHSLLGYLCTSKRVTPIPSNPTALTETVYPLHQWADGGGLP